MPEFFSYSLDPFPCTRTRNQEVQLLTLRRPHLNCTRAVAVALHRSAAVQLLGNPLQHGGRGLGGEEACSLQVPAAAAGGGSARCAGNASGRGRGPRRTRGGGRRRVAALLPCMQIPAAAGDPSRARGIRRRPAQPTAGGASGGWGRGARGSGAERTRRLDAGSMC